MKFCSQCGAAVERRIPAGEDRERWVCNACGTVHYENPRMVVGCIIEQDNQILLCKRAIEPRLGYWTVPAGFLELGESTVQGAIRETHEEAGARVKVIAPYAHFDIPHIGQAYIFYRAKLISPELSESTSESLEIKLVPAHEIPWNELAFPVVKFALELHEEDMKKGAFRYHHAILVREAGKFSLHEHMTFTLPADRVHDHE